MIRARRRFTQLLGSSRFRFYSVLSVFFLTFSVGYWVEIVMPIAFDPTHSAPEVWAHRGSGGRLHPENSMEAVRLGIEEGFPGIEIDVFYFSDTDRIIVAHDRPGFTDGSTHNVLSDYEIPQEVNLWVDSKNLVELDENEIEKFATSLRNLPFEDRVFVESKSIGHLYELQKHGIKTVLWLEDWTVKYIGIAKFLVRILGIHAVSVDVRNLQKIESHFGERSILVFTINDPQEIRDVMEGGKVSVVLTDLSCWDSGCAE